MKTEKEILKENDLTNIDGFMDVQFGKPGAENGWYPFTQDGDIRSLFIL